MAYNQNFIHHCEELYIKIQENKSIQECLNTTAAAAAAAATAKTDSVIDIYEPLWFVYYMFFAIHNPKMEDYIHKKSIAVIGKERNPQDIIKNLIKRRKYTSTIVYQLYTHAYTNEGSVTHIYPKYKNNIAEQLIKSFQDNHLKTTAVLLRRQQQQHSGETAPTPAPTPTPTPVTTFLEYVITTQPIIPAVSGRIPPLIHKIENINYKRKDLILLALVCYMKIDEDDINKKNIFISATDEELKDAVIPLHP